MEEMAITTLGKKQILFGCESVYQLFNAIILRMTVCAENDCDIILSNITTWQKDMLQRLEEAKVFRKVFCPDTHALEYDFWPLATEEKKKNRSAEKAAYSLAQTRRKCNRRQNKLFAENKMEIADDSVFGKDKVMFSL